MTNHISWASLVVAVLTVGVSAGGDTFRLGGRPSDEGDTRRLDLKPGNTDGDTQLTRGYGYRGVYYGGFGYRGTYWGGYGFRGYGFGISYGYGFRPAFYPSYSYSYYYAPPVYSYYSAPVYYAPTYYAPPVYYSLPNYGCGYYPIAMNGPAANPPATQLPAPAAAGESKSFRYDGGPDKPAERIPPAREADLPPVPTVPADPMVPKLGPTPTERNVSIPVRKKVTYPAYGDDRKPPRDDKSLLIRGDR